jgi:Flp pilus assembly protein TadD
MKSLLLLFAVLLAGCASTGLTPTRPGSSERPQGCTESLDEDQQLALKLAQDLAGEGRPRAALAHLEALPPYPHVRLSKARILRKLDQDGAEALFQSLPGTCLAAAGNQGLGQLAMQRGDHQAALAYLRNAVHMDPTDARMRNDLGLIQLHLGQLEAARFELLTALELDPEYRQPALNLLTLLFHEGQWQQAAELGSRLGLDAEHLRRAQLRAKALASVSTHTESFGHPQE